jgi:hypothetical protein
MVTIGTVIEGTHRHADIAAAFGELLARLTAGTDEHSSLVVDCKRIARMGDMADDADDVVAEVMDALCDYAPPYCYFGAHEGDGADYGFRPSIESVMDDVRMGEIAQVADPADVPESGCAVFVNDRGNVSLYVDGAMVWNVV